MYSFFLFSDTTLTSTMSVTLPQLLETLRAATTADTSLLRASNEQLDAWEVQQEYWTGLLDITFDRSVPDVNIRRLAIIRFKNGVTRYWRDRIVNRVKVAIQPKTKEVLRTRLLDVVYEPDRVSARQVAVAIARIARLDYPSAWPTLFSSLHEAIVYAAHTISSPDARLVLIRAAETLVQVLKEFESVRVMAGRLRMQELARELLPSLLSIQAEVFTAAFADTEDLAAWAMTPHRAELIRASHLLLKAMQRLALSDVGLVSVRGVTPPQENIAYTFFAATPPQLSRIWAIRSVAAGLGPELALLLTKHMVAYAKIHLAFATRSSSNVVNWPGWDEAIAWYRGILREAASPGVDASISRPEGEDGAMYPYRLLVLALRLLHTSVEQWHRSALPTPAMFSGTQGAEFELDTVDILLSAYLRLTPVDLERWQENAEEFSIENDQADAELDIRPAAEQLISTLALRSRRGAAAGVDPRTPSVTEHIWGIFDASATYSTESLEDILAREAVYLAVGICRNDDALAEGDEDPGRLSTAIEMRLVPEANSDAGTAWVIIRRRVACLIWDWCEYVPDSARPAVYGLLVNLLRGPPGKTDAAVQLAAAKSLSGLADTILFDADVFSPYLGDILAGLMQLIVSGVVSEPDSIRILTNTLAVLTDRVGMRTLPYAQALLHLIPSLWDAQDPEARARPSIIEFLGKLARAVSPGLQAADDPTLLALHTVVAYVVRSSLDESAAPLLGYDACLLWARTLQSAHHFTMPLFSLLDLVAPLMLQPDNAPLSCRISDEAFMLMPQDVLRHFGSEIIGSIGEVLGDSESPTVLPPVQTLESIMRCLSFPDSYEALMYFAELLHRTDLVGSLVGTLVSDKEATTVATQFASVIARMAYMLPTPLFHELVRAGTPRVSSVVPLTCPGDVWNLLIPALTKCTEYINVTRRLKILALGLANIVRGAGDADIQVFKHIPIIIGVWTDVLGCVVEDASGFSQLYERETADALADEDIFDQLLAQDTWGELENQAPNAKRSEKLLENDPVTKVQLREYIATTLNGALAIHPEGSPSGTALRESLASMDPLVLEVLQKDLVQKPA